MSDDDRGTHFGPIVVFLDDDVTVSRSKIHEAGHPDLNALHVKVGGQAVALVFTTRQGVTGLIQQLLPFADVVVDDKPPSDEAARVAVGSAGAEVTPHPTGLHVGAGTGAGRGGDRANVAEATPRVNGSVDCPEAPAQARPYAPFCGRVTSGGAR